MKPEPRSTRTPRRGCTQSPASSGGGIVKPAKRKLKKDETVKENVEGKLPSKAEKVEVESDKQNGQTSEKLDLKGSSATEGETDGGVVRQSQNLMCDSILRNEGSEGFRIKPRNVFLEPGNPIFTVKLRPICPPSNYTGMRCIGKINKASYLKKAPSEDSKVYSESQSTVTFAEPPIPTVNGRVQEKEVNLDPDVDESTFNSVSQLLDVLIQEVETAAPNSNLTDSPDQGSSTGNSLVSFLDGSKIAVNETDQVSKEIISSDIELQTEKEREKMDDGMGAGTGITLTVNDNFKKGTLTDCIEEEKVLPGKKKRKRKGREAKKLPKEATDQVHDQNPGNDNRLINVGNHVTLSEEKEVRIQFPDSASEEETHSYSMEVRTQVLDSASQKEKVIHLMEVRPQFINPASEEGNQGQLMEVGGQVPNSASKEVNGGNIMVVGNQLQGSASEEGNGSQLLEVGNQIPGPSDSGKGNEGQLMEVENSFPDLTSKEGNEGQLMEVGNQFLHSAAIVKEGNRGSIMEVGNEVGDSSASEKGNESHLIEVGNQVPHKILGNGIDNHLMELGNEITDPDQALRNVIDDHLMEVGNQVSDPDQVLQNEGHFMEGEHQVPDLAPVKENGSHVMEVLDDVLGNGIETHLMEMRHHDPGQVSGNKSQFIEVGNRVLDKTSEIGNGSYMMEVGNEVEIESQLMVVRNHVSENEGHFMERGNHSPNQVPGNNSHLMEGGHQVPDTISENNSSCITGGGVNAQVPGNANASRMIFLVNFNAICETNSTFSSIDDKFCDSFSSDLEEELAVLADSDPPSLRLQNASPELGLSVEEEELLLGKLHT